jgi:hypothetical protein
MPEVKTKTNSTLASQLGSGQWREGSDYGMLQDLANTYLNAPSAAGNIFFRANNSLDTISRLIGVSFDWKKSGDHSIGFIAQEVESVLPEIVSTDKEGYKSLDYGKVI